MLKKRIDKDRTGIIMHRHYFFATKIKRNVSAFDPDNDIFHSNNEEKMWLPLSFLHPLRTLPSYLNPISLCLRVFFCFPLPVDGSECTHTSISSFGLQSLFFSFKISQSFYFVCNELQLIVTRRQQLCHHALIRNCTVTKAIGDEVVTQKGYCTGQRLRKQKVTTACFVCLIFLFCMYDLEELLKTGWVLFHDIVWTIFTMPFNT